MQELLLTTLLGAGALAAHHPLRMKETPFSLTPIHPYTRPSGSPVAYGGKPSCSAGLTRYQVRETLLWHKVPRYAISTGSPTPLCFLKAIPNIPLGGLRNCDFG